MKIYIFAEHEDLPEHFEAIFAELSQWSEPKTTIDAVKRLEDKVITQRDIEVGLELSCSKEQKLRDPLKFMSKMAKKFNCDFVVGSIEGEAYSDVCYFGAYEGPADSYEIASYLGLL